MDGHDTTGISTQTHISLSTCQMPRHAMPRAFLSDLKFPWLSGLSTCSLNLTGVISGSGSQ